MRTIPLAAVVVVVLSGCSSSTYHHSSSSPYPVPGAPQGSPSMTAGATGPQLHAVRGNQWSPSTLTLTAGQTLTVVDTDPDAPHNFTVAGLGHSGTLQQGDTFRMTFPKAGTFAFVCTFHQAQGMKGTITVTG